MRRFGGWSNRRSSDYLERCAMVMEAADVPLDSLATVFDINLLDDAKFNSQNEQLSTATPSCPHCGQPMRPDRLTERTAWELFRSSWRPNWYQPFGKAARSWNEDPAADRIRKGCLGPWQHSLTANWPPSNTRVGRPSSTPDLSLLSLNTNPT